MLCALLGGVILGTATYSLGGVIWRCMVVALTGALAIWALTGSLAIAANKWPERINHEGRRTPQDLWRAPAVGMSMADPAQYWSRLGPRLRRLSEDSLAARQILFDSAEGRLAVGDRVHDILLGTGSPPTRAEVQTVIDHVTSLNEHTGSGGVRAIDEAVAAGHHRLSIRERLRW